MQQLLFVCCNFYLFAANFYLFAATFICLQQLLFVCWQLLFVCCCPLWATVDVSVNAYRMVTIQPLTTGINPMEFLINALDDCVDLSRSYFTVELNLKKADGTNLIAANKLWVANNLGHSIFKQISMRLNGTLISPQTDTYLYKALFETLLNYNREDGETVLKPQGWFNHLDFPTQWTANNTDVTANAGDGHIDYQALSAAHKQALAQSKTETAHYLDGKTHVLVFQSHLSCGQSIGSPSRNQDEIVLQFPRSLSQWCGFTRKTDPRRHQDQFPSVSYV